LSKIKFILFFLLGLLINSVSAQYKVIGYYADWLKEILPAGKIQCENLTHINHAFAMVDAQGCFDYSAQFLYPALNAIAHDNNIKILIAVGGWGNAENFALMTLDTNKRSQFVDDLYHFVLDYNYDGVDFDWEFPLNNAERAAYLELIRETRARLDLISPEMLLTMAVPTGNWYGQWLDFTNLVDDIDWFNAMCYDFHGSWSAHSGHNAPLYQPVGDSDGSVETALTYLQTTRGIPKNKLTVGIPFYGKVFNSSALYSSFDLPVTDMQYMAVVPLINNGWSYRWDDTSKVPYLIKDSNDKLITFDDTVSVRTKCGWIKDNGYAGAMIWAIGQDATNNGQPLLETIGKNLLDGQSSAINDHLKELAHFMLYQNYPNPFNLTMTINYDLRIRSFVKLAIYDVLGRKVCILVESVQNTGSHHVTFDAQKLPGGTYFYELTTEYQKQSRKMTLIR
jgi:chitinase